MGGQDHWMNHMVRLFLSGRHKMDNQKNFLRDGHNLGTINEKGANLELANPLIFKVPGHGIEPRT